MPLFGVLTCDDTQGGNQGEQGEYGEYPEKKEMSKFVSWLRTTKDVKWNDESSFLSWWEHCSQRNLPEHISGRQNTYVKIYTYICLHMWSCC